MPTIEETLVYPQNDALELDEEWSFVRKKKKVVKNLKIVFLINTKIPLLLAIYGKAIPMYLRKIQRFEKI